MRSERPKHRHPRRARSGSLLVTAAGFTLVEVLMAMLIVGLVAPFVMGGLISSLRHARQSQDRGATTAWAQAELEFLRAQCYPDLAPAVRKITSATLYPGEPPLPAGFAAALIRIDPAETALLKATVNLYAADWSGRDPPAAYFTTSTFIGDFRVAGACP